MPPRNPLGVPTGGPAFPRSASIDPTSGTLPDGDRLIDAYDGMSLRDWFAGQTLCGLMAIGFIQSKSGENRRERSARVAVLCYEVADAMLVARDLPHDLPNQVSTRNRDRGSGERLDQPGNKGGE